ncbi:MAG: chemotaxis-specific protein-glutamate methyltransferase CheB [Actinobacteria bacterium]|nr:chemotaxis-specific protein-glutamate methyltransferase CheB [Actinomycetota bacterium]
MAPARVVIADDSAFMRRLIGDVLTRAGMEVVATVANGREAIEACREHEPDVLSLDLAMPEIDGIEVLRKLRPMRDMRIVVVSSFSESDGARAVDALAEGAFELVPKQASSGKLQDFLDDLLYKIEAAAVQKAREERGGALPLSRAPQASDKQAFRPRRRRRTQAPTDAGRLVVIASSTGGPRALTTVLSDLPESLGQGLLIVQHMPAGFTKSLATRLDAYSELSVSEAAEGDKIATGSALVAPGGRHMRLKGQRVTLSDAPPRSGLRPCADITIDDVVHEYGGNVVLVVLTGMGRDACAGARLVSEAGGIVIAEHGSTTTVNGMPKAVVDANLADVIAPIDKIADAIVEAANA